MRISIYYGEEGYVKIVVCIKQVPGTQDVKVDPNTGVLLRSGIETKMNPYDLYALETARKIKERVGGLITVITMGPPAAKAIIEEAYSLGADAGLLITDRKFAGADVLATSLTLASGIKTIGDVDLILCGKQTTDGDTAQVGPAIAEYLNIPHVSWVLELLDVTEKDIIVKQDLGSHYANSSLPFPCLLTVEKDIFEPQLPSYLLKQAAKDRKIEVISLHDLDNNDETQYGLAGSPTQVEKIFEPETKADAIEFIGNSKDQAQALYSKLVQLKFVSKEDIV